MGGQLENYLLQRLPPVEKWIQTLEKQASKENIPIMDQISMNFLTQLVSIKKPSRILEIGTAIGYSALRMHEAYPSASIITIEKDEYRYKQAIKHIKEQNKQENIQVIYGDAEKELDRLIQMEEQFELIFIDAAKSIYKELFRKSCLLLKKEGLILSDNVLFRGYIAGLKEPLPRYKNMTRKIRDYNDWLMSHPDFVTSIVPIGDGLAISKKK